MKNESEVKKPLDSLIQEGEKRRKMEQDMKDQSAAALFAEYKETIIRQVNGSMAIEGMPLTAADKQRIRDFAFDPTQIDRVIASLVKKHSVVR